MTYPTTIMIDLVEGVCPYTPPRVLDNNNLETRRNYQQYAENLLPIPIEKHAKPLSTKNIPSTCDG